MSNKILNKVNNDIFSYDTEGGVFKMSRVMPTEIHHVTTGAGTSGYMLTSTGNGWTWTDPSTLGGGGTSLTSGTGVSITNDIISIGQSVGTTDNVTFNSLDANISKTSNLSISSTTDVNVSATQYISLVSQSNFDLTSSSGSMGIYVSSGNFDIYAQSINFRDGAGTVLANNISFTNWNTAYSWGDHSVAGYLNNVNVTTPNTGEMLSYNGTNWVNNSNIKSLTDTLDGTSYDYINVTSPQHVKASWGFPGTLEITDKHAGMVLDGGLFISSKAPITYPGGNNKHVLGAIETTFGGTPTDLEVDFMVQGTSMLIGDTFIGPNGNLVLFGDILSNSGQTILGSGGIVFESSLGVWNEGSDPKTYSSGIDGEVLVSQGHGRPPKWTPPARFETDLDVWNEDTPKTYNSGADGDVLVSQGQGRPPKWIQLEGGTTYIQGEGIHINNNEINVESLYFDNWNTAYSWGDHSVAGYLNNVSISDPSSNQFLTYDGTNWINVNPDTDDIYEGHGHLYYTDERVDTRIALASLDDLYNVKAPSPIVGEILSYNGSNWVRDGTIKSLSDTLDGTSYDYINVTAPQHVKASWSYSTSLDITGKHTGMLLEGGLFISSKAPITDSSGNKQVLGAVGTGADLEVDFMVEGTSMLIGDTFIGPNGNLVLFGDILSNSGQTIIGSGGIVFDSDLGVWNEDTPKTYSSGLDGDVLVSQGQGKPPKWSSLASSGGGVPAPVVTTQTAAQIILPASNLANYDFRTYTLSGTDVIDSNGNVIFTSIGSGSISFTSTDGVYTSSYPDKYLLKSGGLPLIPSGNFSIEFYIKFGPNPTNYHYLFQYQSSDFGSAIQGHIRSNGMLYFQTWHNNNGQPYNVRVMYFDPFDTSTTLDNWDSTNFSHFVFTYEGPGTEQLYHNGSLVTVKGTEAGYNDNIAYDPNEPFETLHIGGVPQTPIAIGAGDTVDDTTKFHRLYDGVLTTDEIISLYDNRENSTSSGTTDVTNYAIVSNNATGTETKWLSVVPAPTITASDTGPTLPDGNLLDLDFTKATISGTNVEIDGTVIGTLAGTSGTTGVTILQADGLTTTSQAHVNITKQVSWTLQFTVEIYFKMNSTVNNQGVFSAWENASAQGHVILQRKNTSQGFIFSTAGATATNILDDEQSTPGFNGEWGHLVYTHDSGQSLGLQKKVYINGVLRTGISASGSDEVFATGIYNNFWVGAAIVVSDTGEESIKVFRIFNRVLNEEEITNLYNHRDGSSSGEAITDVTNYVLASNNVDGTGTKWSNDVVDKSTNQYISGFKNFSDFMGIAIGPTQSDWPLRIGSNGPSISGNLYLYAHGAEDGGAVGNHNQFWISLERNKIGLYVDEGIRAGRLYIMSDRRIKKDIVDIQDDEALNKLRVLQPKKYKYIDPVRGTHEVYGFIAQEVAEVIPYSVSLEKSYLPSHMIFCKIIDTTVNTSTIDTEVSHTLIVNDFLCFRDNKYNLIEGAKVIEIIDDKTIKVDRIFNKEDTVYTTTTGETVNDVIYLYGKKIDDFHILNKDTIWTVATAALQEVDRQLQAEKSKTSDLISRLEALKVRIEALEGLEARLEILESK